MSAVYEKNFSLPASVAELVTGANGTEAIQLSAVTLTNTSAGAVTVTLHLADDGGAAGADNIIVCEKVVEAKSDVGVSLTGHAINPGAKLYGFASTGSVVNLFVSGIVSGQASRVW